MKLISIVLAASVLSSSADIITLKNGQKLNATIKSKTLEEYVLEVQVTKSIKETRTVKREDVVNIERVKESNTAFEEIEGLDSVPPYSEKKEYEARIRKIKSFIKRHEISSGGVKAKRMLKALEAERKVIADGGIKTESGLLTAEERKGNRVSIDSKIAYRNFEQLLKSRSYIPALRAYDILEGAHFGTAAHRNALPQFQNLVASYFRAVAQQLDSFDNRMAQRDRTYATYDTQTRDRAIEEESRRAAAFAKLREREEEEGITWPSVDFDNADSMEHMLKLLEREPRRLEKITEELAEIKETGTLFQAAWEAAGNKDRETLEPLLDELEDAGFSEKLINEIIDRYDPTINNPPAEDGEDAGDSAPEE
ncbi:MAG: PTPDL family protein [Verrucomicrobiota bacterium]